MTQDDIDGLRVWANRLTEFGNVQARVVLELLDERQERIDSALEADLCEDAAP